MKKKLKITLLIGGFLCGGWFTGLGYSQQFLLDKPVRAGELILFPEVGNENNYYYLTDKVKLATHANGKPKFSFIRYVKNEETEENGDKTITESTTGGGIVHAVIELSVSEDQRKDAERALKRIKGSGKLVGPIMYKGGTVSLISSVAKPGGETAQQVLGIGTAPILDGHQAAISVQLNKIGSKILWETFKTPTPDFSVSFEMEVEGYLSPKRVLIEADFARIYSNEKFEAAATTPVLAGEINITFDELHDSGAIKVTQVGSDENLDQLMETAYSKLTDLMFDKIGGTGTPELSQLAGNNQESMLDRATDMLNTARRETREENRRLDLARERQAERERVVRTGAQSRRDQIFAQSGRSYTPPTGSQARNTSESGDNTPEGENENNQIPQNEVMPGLSVAVSYSLKKTKRTGSYKLDLNKFTSDSRTMRFDENLGGFSCAECFVEVNLDDPLMKQREIYANLDGLNSEDFGKYINYVNVVIKKKHQNNELTLDEIRIDKSKFNATGNIYKMLYGWKGDNDRTEWLDYEYKTQWNFFGGHQLETDWVKNEFGSISLTPPLIKKPIFFEADPEFIEQQNVRAIELKIYSKNGEKESMTKATLNTSKQQMSNTLEILLPKDVEDYEYEITWFVKGKDPIITARQPSKSGLLFFDHFPEN